MVNIPDQYRHHHSSTLSKIVVTACSSHLQAEQAEIHANTKNT